MRRSSLGGSYGAPIKIDSPIYRQDAPTEQDHHVEKLGGTGLDVAAFAFALLIMATEIMFRKGYDQSEVALHLRAKTIRASYSWYTTSF